MTTMNRLFQLLAVGCVWVFLSGCSPSTRKFHQLAELSSNQESAAIQLAKSISNETNVVELALADFTLWGGSNRGMSSWILANSELKDLVVSRLQGILNDPSEERGRRIESCWVLWLRTGVTNLTVLSNWFVLVQSPGDEVVAKGRRRLSSCIDSNARELRSLLEIPKERPLDLSTSRFVEMISGSNVLVRLP